MGFSPQLDLALLLTTMSCGPDRTLARLHMTRTGLKAREVASTPPPPGTRSCCLAHPKALQYQWPLRWQCYHRESRCSSDRRRSDPTEPDSPWATEPVGRTPGGRPRALESIRGQCHQRTEGAVKPGTSRVNLPRLGPAQA